MPKNKSPFIGTRIIHRTNRAGQRVKAGVTLVREDGTEKTLLNPAAKAAKYARELQTGERCTNEGLIKNGKNDKPLTLNAKQRAYRSGYLDAQKDNVKAYKAKNAKSAAKEKNRKNTALTVSSPSSFYMDEEGTVIFYQ